MKYLLPVLLLLLSLLMYGAVEAQATPVTPIPTQTASVEQRLGVLESKMADLEQKAGSSPSDLWSFLGAIAGFMVAGVGVYFTHKYNERQTQIARVQAIHDFMDDLLSEVPADKKKEIAIRLIATTDCNFAVQIASILGFSLKPSEKSSEEEKKKLNELKKELGCTDAANGTQATNG